MMGIGMAVRPPRQLSLMARAISAIRRNNGTSLYVPDDYGLVLGPELSIYSGDNWVNGGSGTYTKTVAGWSPLGLTYGAGTVGKYFRVTFKVDSVSAGTTLRLFRRNVGNTYNDELETFTIAAGGTYTSRGYAVTFEQDLDFWLDSDTFVGTLSQVAFREILSATTYIDSTGTLPVTAVNDLVGLLTDRSYGAGNLGVELWSAGGLTVAPENETVSVNTVVGKTYRIYCPRADVGFNFGPGWITLAVGWNHLVSNGTGGRWRNWNTTTPVTFTPSIREVLGNHATQPTTASKPLVTRVPKRTRGPVNQLIWSADLTNAAWSKRGTVAVTPNYSQGLARVAGLDVGTAGDIFQLRGTGYTDLQAYTPALMLAQDPACTTGLLYVLNPQNDGRGRWSVNLALLSASPALITKGHPAVTVETEFVGAGVAGGLHLRKNSGTGTLSVLVGATATFNGTYTAQQILDNGGIPLTTTEPLPNVLEWTPALKFDGSNDSLTLGSGAILQQGSDHWVTVAGRLDAGAGGWRQIYGSRNQPAFHSVAAIMYRGDNGKLAVQWQDNAGTFVEIQESVSSKGQPIVATAACVGGVRKFWVNGVLQGTNATALGATTITTATVGASAENGTLTNFWSGEIADIALGQSTLAEADRKTIERNMAQRIGATYVG